MKAFLVRLYSFCFVDELMLIYPYYAIMFADRGLSGWEISLLFAAWSGIVIALELPSGALADRFSRKSVLFVGQLIRVAGYTCWVLYPEFWGFFVGFVLWGTESALSSGAFEALVFDELKRHGREAEYVRVLGRTRSFGYLGMIASSLAASALIAFGYELLVWGSVAAVLVAAVLVLTLPDAPAAAAARQKSYFSLLGEGVRFSAHHPIVLRLVLFAAFAVAVGGIIEEYCTLFADEAGMPAYGMGLFLAVVFMVPAIASFLAHRFEALPQRTFCIALFSCGVLLIAAAWQMSLASIALLVLFTFFIQVIDLVFDGRLQHVIPSDTRATISSVRGLTIEIGAIMAFLGMGGIVGDGSYRGGFLVFGAVLLAVGLVYSVWVVPLLQPRR